MMRKAEDFRKEFNELILPMMRLRCVLEFLIKANEWFTSAEALTTPSSAQLEPLQSAGHVAR
jgi:hypothetical protein